MKKKIVYLRKESMNKIIKSCYNFDLYRSNLLKELYTAYLNYAKQVDSSVLLQISEFDAIFDEKVERCAYWLEFTRSNYNDDLTRSRECIDYGLGLINTTLSDTKDTTFSRVYWQFVTQMASILATKQAGLAIYQYLPKKMKWNNNRILEQEMTPKQKELVKLEEKNDKGYMVKIDDIKTDWKFQVHPDPGKGLDLESYDKESNIRKFDIETMFREKEMKADIQVLMQKSDEIYNRVFPKHNAKKDK